jgi:CubicO group peptidase (beta-lactamase class C family)
MADFLSRLPRRWRSEECCQLRAFVEYAMRLLQVPGVALAVVERGNVAQAEGFGYCSIDRPTKISASTPFRLGSTTKSLTSLLVAALVDRGDVDWTTPITNLLPEFALADQEAARTLLLKHTMGAGCDMPTRETITLFHLGDHSPEERITSLRGVRPQSAWGEKFRYSNTLTALGGYAAAQSYVNTGSLQSSFRQAMVQNIFQPLEMNNTFLLPEDRPSAQCAQPHAIDLEGILRSVPPKFERFVDSMAPAGAIWSTAADMARYLVLELGSNLSEASENVVSREQLEYRWRNGIEMSPKSRYGLGMILTEVHGMLIVGHGGNTHGFSSDLFFMPEHDLGVVILTNRGMASDFLTAIRQRFLELAFGVKPCAEAMAEQAACRLQEVPQKLGEAISQRDDASLELSGLLGEYRSDELGYATLRKHDDEYQIDFDDWSSTIGYQHQAWRGMRCVVLTGVPWSGALQLRIETNRLVLGSKSGDYIFQRIS